MKENKDCDCSFNNFCFIRQKDCNRDKQASCSESSRREVLGKKLCPIMSKYGYPEKTSNCDMPIRRAAIPKNIPCCINNAEDCVLGIIHARIPLYEDTLESLKIINEKLGKYFGDLKSRKKAA